MDLNHDFGQSINMRSTGQRSYEPGVELGRNGSRLKLAQGPLLRYANILAMTGTVAMLTVTAGIEFNYLWQESPILIALGNVTAVVFLLVGQVATFFWYLITGMKGPMNTIYDALPAGDATLRASVCFFPMTLTALAIGIRTYWKIYVSTPAANIFLCTCIILIVLCVLVLHQA